MTFAMFEAERQREAPRVVVSMRWRTDNGLWLRRRISSRPIRLVCVAVKWLARHGHFDIALVLHSSISIPHCFSCKGRA